MEIVHDTYGDAAQVIRVECCYWKGRRQPSEQSVLSIADAAGVQEICIDCRYPTTRFFFLSEQPRDALLFPLLATRRPGHCAATGGETPGGRAIRVEYC